MCTSGAWMCSSVIIGLIVVGMLQFFYHSFSNLLFSLSLSWLVFSHRFAWLMCYLSRPCKLKETLSLLLGCCMFFTWFENVFFFIFTTSITLETFLFCTESLSLHFWYIIKIWTIWVLAMSFFEDLFVNVNTPKKCKYKLASMQWPKFGDFVSLNANFS